MDTEHIDITVYFKKDVVQWVKKPERDCNISYLRCIPYRELESVMAGIFMAVRAGVVYKIEID